MCHKIRIILFGLFCLISLSITFFLFYPIKTEKEIIIRSGISAREISRKLKKEKLIRSEFLFLALVSLTKTSLKAGHYTFSSPSTFKTFWKLKRGKVALLKLVIPEGLTCEQIATLLETKGWGKKEEFLSLTRDSVFLSELGILQSNLEGYLFPDTYYLTQGLPVKEIIKLMVKRFQEVFTQEYKKIASPPFSPYPTLILASIIEREAKLKEERFLISAVFHNRLKKKLPLSSCATVRYALRKFKGKLTLEDLKVASPYNTYTRLGLPPTPICSPGRASIQAALLPAKVDYLYFVSKGDGSHYFSTRAREHNLAKQKFQSP
jgi:UPF0755 protein